MLSRDELDSVSERLENWGRWSADHRPCGASPLWRLIRMNDPARRSPDPVMEVDERDAEHVNRAWRRLPEAPARLRLAKRVVAVHYCYPHISRALAARSFRVRMREYEEMLALGKELLYRALERLDKQREACHSDFTKKSDAGVFR